MQYFKSLICGVIATSILTTIASNSCLAQTNEEKTIRFQSVNQEIDRSFYHDSGDFFENQTITSKFFWIFGFGGFGYTNGFPENEIMRDVRLTNVVWQDYLNQQMLNGPTIRTPDLPNPFNSSLIQSPQFNINSGIPGTELVYETPPSKY